VTDDEQRAVERTQSPFKHFGGFDIEVVGGLVENEQPWWMRAGQHAGEAGTQAFSAR